MRLAKFLAGAGVASRRAAEQIVRDGRVTVDGQTVVDPAFGIEPETGGGAVVAVDGRTVEVAAGADLVVYAVNKPIGVVSTAADPQGRRTVVSLIKSRVRLYPVGRLDADTTGLILLTNDGALAYRLTHPSFEVDKTYQAVVRKPPVRERELRALRTGVELDDGRTAPARVSLAAPDTLMLTIHEGRKRQVKRMCAAVGHPVVSLTRVRFGPLTLGDLAPGQYRRLGAAELSLLRNAGSADRHAEESSRSGRTPTRSGSRSAGGKPPTGRR
jgi:23S rRNA pseudouridine2605 synthase